METKNARGQVLSILVGIFALVLLAIFLPGKLGGVLVGAVVVLFIGYMISRFATKESF